MNRRIFIKLTSILPVSLAMPALGAEKKDSSPGVIGKMPKAEFTKMNMEAGEKVKAIKPAGDRLSEADQKLLVQIAIGGRMQLELSQLAVKQATSEDVRTYAQAEVDEQTGLSEKLREIAAMKQIAVPEELDDQGKETKAKLKAMKGADFDAAYLRESGVKGHEMLQATMKKVQNKAADPTLKILASTTLPLIGSHLQAAKDESASMA